MLSEHQKPRCFGCKGDHCACFSGCSARPKRGDKDSVTGGRHGAGDSRPRALGGQGKPLQGVENNSGPELLVSLRVGHQGPEETRESMIALSKNLLLRCRKKHWDRDMVAI
jgi:hypothetical protein